MKTILLTITLLSIHLYSETINITGTKPVDEGQKLIHKEDTIKSAEDINNSYQYKEKSFEKIKDNFTIKRKDISHSPFTLLHYNHKDENSTILSIEKRSINSINFNIKKSILNVGDKILVINNRNSNHTKAPKGKEVIIEIEIIK